MIASGAPAWAVWLALGLWGLAIVLGAVAFVQARQLWRRFYPMVEPYLTMLLPAANVESAVGTDHMVSAPVSSPTAAPYDQDVQHS